MKDITAMPSIHSIKSVTRNVILRVLQIYVKQTIDAGVEIIKTYSDDIMWLKLCSSFFDIYLKTHAEMI